MSVVLSTRLVGLGRAWALLALPPLLLSTPGVGRAQTGSSTLSRAARAYENRWYRQVIQILRPALYPRSTLTSQAEEVRAYTLLGKAYWWRRQLTAVGPERQRLAKLAAQQFAALLSLQPDARLSRLIHPKALVDFFDSVRKRLRARSSPVKALEAELSHCRKQLQEVRGRFKAYKKAHRTRVLVETTVERRRYFWNFVPFGVGQFQNGQTLKGGLFAAGQGALLLTSVSMLLLGESPYLRTKWGGQLRPGVVAKERANQVQIASIVVGSLFWPVLVWGIVDALYFYRPTRVVRRRRLVPVGAGSVELSPRFGNGQYALDLTIRF